MLFLCAVRVRDTNVLCVSWMHHADCDPVPGAEGGVDVPDKDYEDDGGDSKSLRLTLMEEVLLLGLKDREVYI